MYVGGGGGRGLINITRACVCVGGGMHRGARHRHLVCVRVCGGRLIIIYAIPSLADVLVSTRGPSPDQQTNKIHGLPGMGGGGCSSPSHVFVCVTRVQGSGVRGQGSWF